jgi:hypothetical protein
MTNWLSAIARQFFVIACHCGPDPQSMPLGLSGCPRIGVRGRLLKSGMTNWSLTPIYSIVDFTFNLGAGRLQTSTLRRRINQMDWSGASHELSRWIHVSGKVLPGLCVRRQAEIDLFI